ncbi:MAG TPA: GrpB family protein [Anaerolineales bacterium]|nr:GrpB family protein [Anaerolineales bacterium]
MGIYSKLNRPIVVVDYDPQWPVLFEQEKQQIIAALGNQVLLIEHIGSTAVPGLAAKPIIDIGVGIRSLAEAQDLIPSIESLKYIYEPVLEQLLPARRFFWKGTPAIHTYHLHLTEVDSPVLLRPIRFRDYLREHPESAGEYGALKKKLAKRCKQDIGAYVAGKAALVESIMKQAEQEIAQPDTA